MDKNLLKNFYPDSLSNDVETLVALSDKLRTLIREIFAETFSTAYLLQYGLFLEMMSLLVDAYTNMSGTGKKPKGNVVQADNPLQESHLDRYQQINTQARIRWVLSTLEIYSTIIHVPPLKGEMRTHFNESLVDELVAYVQREFNVNLDEKDINYLRKMSTRLAFDNDGMGPAIESRARILLKETFKFSFPANVLDRLARAVHRYIEDTDEEFVARLRITYSFDPLEYNVANPNFLRGISAIRHNLREEFMSSEKLNKHFEKLARTRMPYLIGELSQNNEIYKFRTKDENAHIAELYRVVTKELLGDINLYDNSTLIAIARFRSIGLAYLKSDSFTLEQQIALKNFLDEINFIVSVICEFEEIQGKNPLEILEALQIETNILLDKPGFY